MLSDCFSFKVQYHDDNDISFSFEIKALPAVFVFSDSFFFFFVGLCLIANFNICDVVCLD